MADTNFDAVVATDGFGTTVAGIKLTLVGQASETWDPGNHATATEEVGELTVSGATLGDYVIASFSVDLADQSLTAAVTAADTVTYQMFNLTGGDLNIGSGTIKVCVLRVA